MSELHKGLRAHLVSATETAPLLAKEDASQVDRVFPMVIPQKRTGGPKQLPCVVYAITIDPRQVTQCGSSNLILGTVTLDCYSSKYDEAHALANAVRASLIDFRGLLGAIVRVRAASLQSELDLSDIEPGLYRVQQTWAIWHLE